MEDITFIFDTTRIKIIIKILLEEKSQSLVNGDLIYHDRFNVDKLQINSIKPKPSIRL